MDALRGLAVLALGFAAVFLVVAFLAAGLAVVAFFAGAFLVTAGLVAAGFLRMISICCSELNRNGRTLAAGLAAAGFFASFTGPEGPVRRVSKGHDGRMDATTRRR